ncbi:MAG: AbrB/MazE/SpoVT family DNA-binding domain-containing protein [Alphaproteobacteria bacterium]|nr:AbrB/MazE/SpoVT family DNA-binding domain-containing protein [Alphaproteobacteria bacterium]MBU1526225.1 AbrB/MazE/SpoVT family DNA-binding domain-containing protein [Alphaproteobacteria bacterium]MBU2116436.1 AbrB/MazE/SpoVT family DNA-binding domain-containing protein [Alphaproteobacteria bacterium]MBU2351382.1 AbrB/MazE/SpoVT family DNA-binding domain-containing protein [Alphaproteobacteria bacterium]MBU2382096.1 AbrB/MazE/SpoVT family DNA-binding domain-containing protein [Alphaproteobac
MGSAIRKIGNSAGVILPKPVLEALGAKLGDVVEFVTEGSVVRIATVKRDPRDGWEEDSRKLGRLGVSDETREWLEAPLNAEADAEWAWDGEW